MKTSAVPILLSVLLLPLCGGCSLFRRSGERPPYKKMSAPVAYELMRDNPEMLVLDLRPLEEYNGATGHIRRAQNLPLAILPYRLARLDAFRDDTFLVYCGADDCGEKAMTLLVGSAFENAILIDGGIDAWIRKGFKTVLPTSPSRAPAPAEDGRGPVMPVRPGKPLLETPVEPPPPPGKGSSADGRVAAPRQIG